MTDLNAIPHDNNLARITITRLGEGRNTVHRVLPQSEAKQASDEATGVAAPIVNKYTRGKYGHYVKS